MGTADAVPGVSGGTVALIVGIYDRLIGAISEFSVENLAVLLGAARTPKAALDDEEVRRTIDRMEIPFLLALVCGIFTAVIVLTRIVTIADEHNPVAMFALFLGLIGASGALLFRDIQPLDRSEGGAALAGVVLALLVSGITGSEVGHSLPIVFFAGTMAVSAMVMPGLSGSLLLVLFGQYTYLSGVLSDLTSALVDLLRGGGFETIVDRGMVVLTFIAGGIVGVLTIARIVDRALEWNRSVTIAFLIGLVLGALRAPIREINDSVVDWAVVSPGGISLQLWSPRITAVVCAWAVIGAGLILLIDRYLYRIHV